MPHPLLAKSHLVQKLFLSLLGGAVLLLAVGCSSPNKAISEAGADAKAASSPPQNGTELVVYRTPTCGCCGAWTEQMQAQGFQIQDNIVEDLEAIKAEHGIPQNLESCHTTLVKGYVIEGHVPVQDIQRLLAEKPDVIGLAVPGMPIGSPGMESGDTVEPYASFTFSQAGEVMVFEEHGL